MQDAAILVDRLARKMSVRCEVHPGAIARVAEHLGVSNSTVGNWLYRGVTPHPHLLPAIEILLKRKAFSLLPKKSGRRKLNGFNVK